MQIACRATDELLNGEACYSQRKGQIIIENWRKHHNTKRPHSALGYRLTAPEAIVPMDQRPTMHQFSIWTTQVRPLTTMQFSFSGLARRYAEAWTSRNPDAVAGFYAPDGQIVINHGEPHVGSKAIAAIAVDF